MSNEGEQQIPREHKEFLMQIAAVLAPESSDRVLRMLQLVYRVARHQGFNEGIAQVIEDTAELLKLKE